MAGRRGILRLSKTSCRRVEQDSGILPLDGVSMTFPLNATVVPADQPRTLVTVATYNEIENLPRLVEAIWEVAPQADVLVIDDNSPDGTGRWCDEKAASEKRLKCVHRAGKLGLGTATIAGMKYAIEHGYDHVLNMDADFSHHPRYIPAILAAMG